MSFFCYLLYSHDRTRTYIGATTDPNRRLRQHNRECTGGAKATKGRVWKRAFYISGFPDWTACLQFEWAWKYHSRRLRTLNGRVEGVCRLLHTERSTSTALPFRLWPTRLGITAEPECVHYLDKIERSISICQQCVPVPIHSVVNSFQAMSVDSNTVTKLAQQVEELSASLSQMKARLDEALAKLGENSTNPDAEKKKRAPRTEEQKKAAAEKRRATLDAKKSEEPKTDTDTGAKTDEDGKKKRVPLTEEQKKAAAEKRAAKKAEAPVPAAPAADAPVEAPADKPKKVVKKKAEKSENTEKTEKTENA